MVIKAFKLQGLEFSLCCSTSDLVLVSSTRFEKSEVWNPQLSWEKIVISLFVFPLDKVS